LIWEQASAVEAEAELLELKDTIAAAKLQSKKVTPRWFRV
jgi:hypothetical protein